jgi:hypothetical protein
VLIGAIVLPLVAAPWVVAKVVLIIIGVIVLAVGAIVGVVTTIQNEEVRRITRLYYRSFKEKVCFRITFDGEAKNEYTQK